MSKVVISVENVSKQYRLGLIGSGTLREDAVGWWYKVRGKEDPYAKIGETNDRTAQGNSDYVWALQDINFDVKQGEVLGIIGKNGAGKSTLLKLLSRVTAPTTGSIKVKGRIASLLEVGTGFHPELTGKENIYLNGAIMGMNRAEITSKLDEIIDFAGVERYIDTPVKRYSSGMYVRLAFAVAAHLEPEILIVDEVLAVGDAEFQKKALGKMKDVSSGEGRTVLFVSHNMASVKSLCTSGLVLNNGRISFIGGAEQSVAEYLSRASGETTHTIDISKSDLRLSGMKTILKNVELRDQHNEPRNTFSQGEEMHLYVSYSGSTAEQVSGMGFIIYSADDIRVGGGNTYMASPPPHRLPHSGTIIFKLKGKQFNPGMYTFTVSLGSHQSILLDKVENCISFTILGEDIYETGYLLTKEDGVSVIDFEAELL